MSRLTRFLATLAVPILGLSAQSTLCTPTTSTNTANFDSRSYYFNLKTPAGGSGVTIHSLTVQAAASSTYDVYFRVGGYGGFLTDRSAWTPICGGPANQAFAVPDLAIPAGETIGVALIRSNPGSSLTFLTAQGVGTSFLSGAGDLELVSGPVRTGSFGGFPNGGYAPILCLDYVSGSGTERNVIYSEELNGVGFQTGQPQPVAVGTTLTNNATASLSTGTFLRWEVNDIPMPFLEQALVVPMYADVTLNKVYADPILLTVNVTCDGNPEAAPMACSPADLNNVSQFAGSAVLEYPQSVRVDLEAPPFSNECAFVRWLVDGVPQERGDRDLRVEATNATTLTAEYEAPACVQTNLGSALGMANNSLSTGHALGFDFPLPGGGTTNTIDIASNGYVWLESGSSSNASATSVGSLAQNPPRICALAAQLEVATAGSEVHFGTFVGGATVTWKDVRVAGQSGSFTIQCTLFEGGRVQFSHGGALPAASAVVGVVAGTGSNGSPQSINLTNQPNWTAQQEAGWYWAPSTTELIQRVFSSAPVDGGYTGITYANSCTSTSVVSYGSGCEAPVSFFQIEDGSDLANRSYVLTPNNSGGYTVELSPISLFVNTLGVATNMGDDDLRTIGLPFTFGFPTSATGTSSVDVCSNGYIWLESDPGNGVPTSPDVGDFFNDPARISPLWVDLNPADSLSDDVYVRVQSNRVVVTWNECVRFLTNLKMTAQCVLHSDGSIYLNYGSPTYAAANVLTGFTPGNGTASVANNELATSVPFGTGSGSGLPLALESTDFPTLGTSMTFHVSNLPVFPTIGLSVVGLQQANVSLGFLGAPDCWLLATADVIDAALVNAPTHVYSMQLPAQAQLAGVSLFVQYAAFAPSVNDLGFVTSNGLELVLGDV